jgi:epoxyqueuosine reductase
VTLAEVAARLAPHRLAIFGGFHPLPEDGLPPDIATVLMLGPEEPGYWAHLTAQPEWQDDTPDPVDRWSRRVIGHIACDLGGKAYFPFGGPPYHPFYRWSLRTGRAWDSPVRLLVHETAGLLVSYRGALALRDRLDLPPPAPRPCDACTKPCLVACPAGALTGKGYDVPACHSWLDSAEGAPCLSQGCAVRLSCPLSQTYGRLAEQSAYHMRQFHK